MQKLKKLATPYLFLLPAFVGLSLFRIYPIFYSLWQSLYTLNFITKGKTFVGLKNYLDLIRDKIFWQSFGVTINFNLIATPLILLLAFMLALILNRKIKGIGIFRGIQFVPVAVSVPTACILWSVMLSPEQGIVNSLLTYLGLPSQPFLTGVKQALPSIIGIVSWKSVGYWTIFLLAGLQEVPGEVYEAAEVDGVNWWQRFYRITCPLMARPLTFVLVAMTTAHFLLFSSMYILTQGGPLNSTNTLMLEAYKSMFLYSEPGRASAIVVTLFIVTLAVVAIQFKFLKAKD